MKASQGYMALVGRFPLRPIRNAADYEAAIEMVQDLSLRYDDLAPGEVDYFDGLSQFVAQYEKQCHRIDLSHLDPRAMLRFLMDENGMSVADLGRLLGNPSEASMVLSGQRELSKKHIRVLSTHFSVDAGLFLGCEPQAVTEFECSGLWSSMMPESDADRGNVWTVSRGKGCQQAFVPPFADGFEYRMAG